MTEQLHGYSKHDLKNIFKAMASSRRMDEKMLTLLRRRKSFFYIGAIGLLKLLAEIWNTRKRQSTRRIEQFLLDFVF